MKKIFLIWSFAITGFDSICQVNDLASFGRQRINITKKGMIVLGSWSAANIIAGVIGSNANSRQTRNFYQMNVIWGGVNLLIAGLGYYKAGKENTNGVTLTSVLQHQDKIEKTFLFNAALDVAYMTAGLYLTERSRRNSDPSKLKGYGTSVMMQGGSLLLFDIVMYSAHRMHGKKLARFTDKVTVSASPAGFAFIYRL